MAAPLAPTTRTPAPVVGVGDDPFVASVVTPEAVLLELRPAGLGSRMLALGLDLLLQFGALWVLLVGWLATGQSSETAAVVASLVIVFLITFGYPVVMETLWGRSLGKLALGLRVITTEGGPVRFRHAAIRSLLFVVDFWIPPGGLTGVTCVLVTRRSQRLGDLAAGTIVVRSGRRAERTVPVWFTPPPGHEAYARHLDVSPLRPRQYQLVRRFLLRTAELSPSARWELANRLAAGVAVATGGTVPTGMHPETYLRCVVAAHQQRGTPGPSLASPPPPPTGRPLTGPGAPPPPPGSAPGTVPGVPPAPSPAGGPLSDPGAPPPPSGRPRPGPPPPPPS